VHDIQAAAIATMEAITAAQIFNHLGHGLIRNP
jgi:hypothetical protein